MIKVIIVDDETSGRDMLKQLFRKHFPEIDAVGVAHSVESAIKIIPDLKPEIVFLDIEMPNGSGFDVLKRLSTIPFSVIFVTAHDHYAIKAIKHAADDYILKPIDIDDLKNAITKFSTKRSQQGNRKFDNFPYSDNPVNYTKKEVSDELQVKMNEIYFNFELRIIKDMQGNTLIRLTKKEALLLELLYNFRETYLKRDYALNKLWGNIDFYTSRSMDVYIAKLRKLLKKHKITIVNIYGDGFRIESLTNN